MTTQHNNEAASAPDLQSRINAELAKAFKDDPANACRAHSVIKSILAHVARQESAADSFPDECVASGLTCHYGPNGPKGERQCKYCGATPSAAVAEGVDTALPPPALTVADEPGRGHYYTAEQMKQQREAGRREVVEGVKEFARCQLDAARLEVAKDCVAALAAAPPAKAEGMTFSMSELDLIWTEANAAIENGAQDADFPTIREKVGAERVRRAILAQQAKGASNA